MSAGVAARDAHSPQTRPVSRGDIAAAIGQGPQGAAVPAPPAPAGAASSPKPYAAVRPLAHDPPAREVAASPEVAVSPGVNTGKYDDGGSQGFVNPAV